MFTTRRPPGLVTRASSAAKRVVVGHVLQHVHHHHPVEAGVGEGQPVAADEVDVLADQRADRGHRLLGEVARGPRPAPLAQQQADDAVVGAEVEAAQALGRAEHPRHLGELPLLEDRAAEERHRPVARARGLSHGAPASG